MDYSNSVFWFESVFRFVLFMYKLSTESSILVLWRVAQLFHVKCIHSPPQPFKRSPSQTGLAFALQLTLFPPQMTALTWKMSDSLCQCCLASSNICEVLSSSLQLRRTVSQESRLLTRNTAKTAKPSALKHIHSACSFASTKDCISPKFVVFKAALSPCCGGPCIA